MAIPTVTTQDATNIEDISATLNGNITNTGNGTCDERGFESIGVPLASSALDIMSHAICYHDGYVYVCEVALGAKIWKISATNYSSKSSLECTHNSTPGGYIRDIIYAAGYLWASDSDGWVYKINPATFLVVAAYQPTDPPEGMGSLCSDGTYIYAGHSGGTIAKINISTEAITTNDYGNQNWHALIEDGDYLYGNDTTNKYCYKINKSDLSSAGYASLVENCCDDIAQDDTYVYLGSEWSGKIFRVTKSNLALSSSTAPTGKCYGVFIVDSQILYLDWENDIIWRFDSALTLQGRIALNMPDGATDINELADDGTYIHITNWTSPYKILRLNRDVILDCFCWTETNSFGTGAYDHAISNLTVDITYTYRAKAHNNDGWGYGSLIEFTTKVILRGSATLSGVGTLAGIGHITAIGKSTLAGLGTLAGIAHITFAGKVVLAGTGTLAAVWERVKATTATSTGVGTLAAIGVRVRTGAATLSGVGTLASIGHLIAIGKSTLSGVGTLTGKGVLTAIGKATLSGVGSLTALGGIVRTASATLSGVGTLTATAVVWTFVYASATLSGVGTLVAIAHITAIGKATLAGVGNLTALGIRIRIGAATLSGIGTLTVAWTRVRSGAATLSGLGTLAGQGVLIAVGKATLAGVGTLTAVGRLIAIGKATLSGVGTLAAIGTRIRTVTATLSGIGSLTAIASIVKTASATLAGIGTLVVRAIRIRVSPKYILELRNSDGDLVSILQKAYFISYSQAINNAHELAFTLPADDDKVSDIILANEIWLRNHRTGEVIKKFKLGRTREVRESWL